MYVVAAMQVVLGTGMYVVSRLDHNEAYTMSYRLKIDLACMPGRETRVVGVLLFRSHPDDEY